jgi:hypothetical protein
MPPSGHRWGTAWGRLRPASAPRGSNPRARRSAWRRGLQFGTRRRFGDRPFSIAPGCSGIVPSPGSGESGARARPRRFGILPRCGPAGLSLDRRSDGSTRLVISSKRHPPSPFRPPAVAPSLAQKKAGVHKRAKEAGRATRVNPWHAVCNSNSREDSEIDPPAPSRGRRGRVGRSGEEIEA